MDIFLLNKKDIDSKVLIFLENIQIHRYTLEPVGTVF
jgi:hypothetical protein